LPSETSRSAARVRRLAVAALVLCAAAARADSVPSAGALHVQAVIDVLKTGDVSSAVAKLGQGAELDGLVGHPDLVHVLCDRAFRYDNQKAPLDARRTLSARLFELATATLMRAPDDDHARWAVAEATVLRERAGPSSGPESWTQAADLLEKVHAAHLADGLPLAYAVSFLLEGACGTPEWAMALTERADAIAKKAMDAQKDSPTLALTIASSQFWAAKALASSKPKIARNELKVTLDTLRPFAMRPSATAEIGTAYNDVVSFARANNFGFSDKFLTTPKTTLEGSLQFDLPVSSRWSMQSVAATSDTPAYDYVTELSADGARHRQILFRRYAWSQKYTFVERNPVGGDNDRSLAKGLEAMSAAHVFATGAQQSSPQKHACSKTLEGYAFEVKGATQADAGSPSEPVKLYAYVVRGHTLNCYAVLVYVYGKDDDLDPEMESLIASLHEPEKSDK